MSKTPNPAGLIGGFSTNLAFNLLATGLSSIATLLAVGFLSPHSWGITAAVLGIGQVLGSALSFGSQTEHIRRYARLDPTEARVAAVRDGAARMCVAIAVLLLAAVAYWFSAPAGAVLVCSAGVFLSLGNTNYWIARRSFVRAGGILTLEKALAFAAICLFVGTGALTPLILPVVFGAAGTVSGGFAWFVLRIKANSVHIPLWRALKAQWAGSAYFGLASLAPSLLLLDSAIVLAIAGSAQAGYYSVGSKLVAPLSVATTSIVAVLLPYMAVGSARSLPSFNRRTGIPLLCASVAILSVMAYFAPLWVPWLFGEKYSAAVWPIRLYLMNVLIVIFTRILVTVLQAWGDERVAAFMIVLQVLFALVGIAVGAAMGGATSAAASVLTTNIVLTIALLVRVRKLVGESRSAGGYAISADREA